MNKNPKLLIASLAVLLIVGMSVDYWTLSSRFKADASTLIVILIIILDAYVGAIVGQKIFLRFSNKKALIGYCFVGFLTLAVIWVLAGSLEGSTSFNDIISRHLNLKPIYYYGLEILTNILFLSFVTLISVISVKTRVKKVTKFYNKS
jgi:hypothetical protein